jgi:hypothetical protein
MFKLFRRFDGLRGERPDIILQRGNTTLYKYILNSEECNFEFENWDKNRPPDEVRVKQIKEFFDNKNADTIPGIIYAWDKGEDRLQVYDGIHRLLAGKECNRGMICLIQVNSTSIEQEIIDDFLNINKSVSVPSIYLEETSALKKMVCQEVADEMCRRYPKFVSPSRKPYAYNFNRDNLVEFISTLQIDFCKPNINIQIVNELIGMNHFAKDFVSRNKVSYPRKCTFHNFYLFFLDKSVIKNRLEEIL